MQGATFALVEGASTSNGAAVGRIGRGGDGVGLDLLLEVGHQSAVGRNVEGVVGVGRDHGAAFGPIDEVVAFVGRGRNGARSALVEGAAAFDGAALDRVGRHADGVLRNSAADVDVLDVRLALRLGDHNSHLSRSDASLNGHTHRARSRHQSRAFQHIVLRNGHIRAFLCAHLERSGARRESGGVVHVVGRRVHAVGHDGTVAEHMVGLPIVKRRGMGLVVARMGIAHGQVANKNHRRHGVIGVVHPNAVVAAR